MEQQISSFTGKYAFLSNFYSAPIVFEKIEYPTAEHAFQAAKTNDISLRRYIASLNTPGEAKRAGRRLDLRSDWESVKDEVMERICFLKFNRNLGLRDKLLETGDAILIEGNTWNDTYWGMCNGTGLNKLGKILMNVRTELMCMKKLYDIVSKK